MYVFKFFYGFFPFFFSNDSKLFIFIVVFDAQDNACDL